MASPEKEEFICDKMVTVVRDLKAVEQLQPEQIKAARALLGWSQADLAKRSGYSLPAINNIERGIASARAETMTDIQQTFERNGVQFIDGPGVRIENAFFRVKVLEGESALVQLFRSILYVLDKDKTSLYLSGINERYLKEIAGQNLLAFQTKLGAMTNLKVKTLCKPEQDAGVTFVNGEKKLVPADGFPLSPCLIYKDRVARIFFENPFRIMIVTHAQTADLERAQFDFIWNLA